MSDATDRSERLKNLRNSSRKAAEDDPDDAADPDPEYTPRTINLPEDLADKLDVFWVQYRSEYDGTPSKQADFYPDIFRAGLEVLEDELE